MKAQRDRKVLYLSGILVACLALIAAGGYCGYRLIRHEQAQSRQIGELQGMVAEIAERQKREGDYYLYDVSWGDGYNWLALGNSLTLIESWGRGICSTEVDNDYFGLVRQELESRYGDGSVNAFRYNYHVWERSADRESVLDLVDGLLGTSLDLVTIQLGENVGDTGSYQKDLGDLVDYVRAAAPEAQIVIVDEFWSAERSDMRRAVAEEKGCGFADLSGIRGKAEYQSETGTLCRMPDGGMEAVAENAATHPGDEGMRYIAGQIIDEIRHGEQK